MKKIFTSLILIMILIVSMSLNVAEGNNPPESLINGSFEYYSEIEVENNLSIQQLQLPEGIQAKLHFRNASDLSVYNAEGKLLPSIVRFKRYQTQQPKSHKMTFFPLSQEVFNDQKNAINTQQQIELKLEVLVNAQKQLDRIATESDDIKTYIIENPQYDKTGGLTTLAKSDMYQINLQLSDDFDGIAVLKLESSSDLNNWTTLVSRDTVTKMDYMGQQLIKSSIALTRKAQRYIRLSWIGNKFPEIMGLHGIIGKSAIKPESNWSEAIKLTPISGKNLPDNTFSMTISPSFHVDQLRLNSTIENYLYSGSLWTKRGSRNHWRKYSNFQFYQIDSTGGNIAFNQVKFSTSSDEQWRMQFDYPDQISADDFSIKVTRYPIDLYFLKQGLGPYYLGFANNDSASKTSKFESVMSNLLALKSEPYGQAQIKSVMPLIRTDIEQFDWKKILLWTVLISGVVIMGYMARSLFKQIEK